MLPEATSCLSASRSVRNSRVETGSFAALRWRKKSTSTASPLRRLPRALELVAQVPLHRRPFTVDDAEDHGVTLRAVGQHLMIAQDAVLLRAEPLDRGARGMIEPVGAKLDRDALQLLECVGQEHELVLGIVRAALDALGIPGMPDFKTAVGRVDVEVTCAADDLARGYLTDDKRHRIQTLAHVERDSDVMAHFLRRRDRRVPQPPQLAVRDSALQRLFVFSSERLDTGVGAGERDGVDEAHDYLPLRSRKATLSNKCTSCSFLSRAPWSGGMITFLSVLRSASGGMSSASKSFNQSRSSEVDGFFFKPGTSRNSKKTSSASLSRLFFNTGKWTSTMRVIVSRSGNLM